MVITKRLAASLALTLFILSVIIVIGCVWNTAIWLRLSIVIAATALLTGIITAYRDALTTIFHILRQRIIRSPQPDSDIVYPLISEEQKQALADSVTISFTGDLILLREMVERAFNPEAGEYDFEPMFRHVSHIWKESDLAIGVFEGPLCGEELGYSTSNYDDGIPLALNFPDSFAKAVKEAGMDLVTLANNHMFDMGIKPGLRTPEILDKTGLMHVGLHTKKDAGPRHRIIETEGIRIGVLAYTYGMNNYPEDIFFDEATSHYLRPVVRTNSKYFKRNVEMVKEDFAALQAEKPDMIIVLPHMGEQFLSKPDKDQQKWCEVFVQLGADIIFSDHPHHVQPIEWRKNESGKQVLIVHCPGNFINSYTEYDGDASMIVKAHIDRKTCRPFAVSVTPLYAYCPQNGQWTGLPTVKAVTDPAIYDSLSRADFKRINRVNRLVTGIAINAPLDVHAAQNEYISFASSGYVRQLPPPIESIDIQHIKHNQLLQSFESAQSIAFVGDSVTDGTKNGGTGWYEPLMPYMEGKKVMRYAKGSRTTLWMLEHAEEIAALAADLYVVAIGCNDIRYRDPARCAMTAEEYIKNINSFVIKVREHNPESRFVFIAPWRSLRFDAYFHVSGQAERMAIYRTYTDALRSFCNESSHIFLDPNPLIFYRMEDACVRTAGRNPILKDFIHPNACHGVGEYAKAVVLCDQGCHDKKICNR